MAVWDSVHSLGHGFNGREIVPPQARFEGLETPCTLV